MWIATVEIFLLTAASDDKSGRREIAVAIPHMLELQPMYSRACRVYTVASTLLL